jgi:hypothetical protein
MTELVVGQKYLVGLPPWGLQTVIYLGPSFWPGYVKVKNSITQYVCRVKEADLKPLLVPVSP